MHDDSPRSRRDGRDDDHADSAFDALGLSALFGDATQENPVVPEDDGGLPYRAPAASTPEAPAAPAFADTIPAQPASAPVLPWLTDPPAAEQQQSLSVEPQPVQPHFVERQPADPQPVEPQQPQTPASFSWFDSPSDADTSDADPAATSILPTAANFPPATEPYATPAVAFGAAEPVASDAPPTAATTAFDATPTTAFGDAPTTAFDAAPTTAFITPPSSAFGAAPEPEPRSAVPSETASSTEATQLLGLAADSNSGGADGVQRSGGSGRRGSGSGGRGSGSGGRGGSGGGWGGRGHGGSDGPFAGILMLIRKNPRTWLIAAIAAGVVVLSGISFAIGAATSPAQALAATTSTPTTSATPTVKPTVRPTASPAAAPSKIRTCSVDSYASNSGFGTLETQVMNASTGEVLYDRNGSNPAPTASVLKMLTAAAAFSILGPDYRVPTTVVKGSQPGQVVIVGGGDVTLSGLPTGQNSFYTGAPHLDALADQVKQAWASDPSNAGQPITSVVVDTSLFGGPVWLPSWDENEERVVEGSTPYMTALMVDGDRADPTAVESPRSTDPVGRAAQDFVNDLGGGISISQGTAPAGAKQLGQVLSQPVSALAEQALTYSDNTIMEELARLVAIKTGAGNTFAAINAGTLKGLETYGIDETGLYFADGSGLSADNKVPASYLTRFLVKVVNRQGSLGAIYDGMPIAGQTGTLGPGYDRFDGSFSSQADGHVNAKTGWINTARTLAGVIHAQDGTTLTFAVYALNFPGDDAALSAIDDLTTAFYLCGNNLSNN
ncbi:D-alanyl-D-alanine carboxypeptidase/D-alanyl-D-alanine-endopeptidase [Humibacter sp. RRB41]|uniref:D-alanyl-D-alanine carboxypeptidase/D-alanyl-D-alanine-endopeptidase n=1 Tax=Humibacter sp. RRB41 TaxID=2919946 RepID=UPI001FA9D275|nr:D-alanyl-D-alanine carboxypeptidase [Humibacter sp. RRB41]